MDTPDSYIEKYGSILYGEIEKEFQDIIGISCTLKKDTLIGSIQRLWLPAELPYRPNNLWVVKWENNPLSDWGICELKDLVYN